MAEQTIGRYQIQGELGRGAMGLVYKAYDPVLERHAAIKVMTTSGEMDDELRVRFFREARSAARLSNPHIIAIYDMGDDQNRPFIAMEFVEGEDLKALIRQRVFLPFGRKLEIVAQICRALHYAHKNGVIHRDVKPGNVRLTPDGQVKILDFGLARLGASDMTRTGTLMGTPFYMSPEQAKGAREIDGRSDLFSVGVILYEFLCYRRPFEADSPTAVCYQIIAEPHSPLSAHLPGCDAELEAILDRALAKDPDKRFANGEEMAAALSAFAAQLPEKERSRLAKVTEIQAEVERQRAEAQRHPLYSLLDPALLDDTVSPQAGGKTAALPEMQVGADQTSSDYGVLLQRQAQLEKALQSMARDLEKIRPLVESFEQCKGQLQAEQWDDCLANVRQMLKSFPRNPDLLAIEKQCVEAIDRKDRKQEQLRQLVGEARQALAEGDYEVAGGKAKQALILDPDCAEALKLSDEAARIGSLRQAERLLAEARDCCRTGRFEESRNLIDKGLALDPDSAELKALLERVETLESLIRQASNSIERGAYEEALEIAGHALEIEAEQPAAIEIRKTASEMVERRKQLRQMRSDAERLLSEGQYNASAEICHAALKLGGENSGFRRIEKQALAELKKQKQAEQLLADARERLLARDFEESARQARAVLELIAQNAEAVQILESAQAGIRDQKRLNEVLRAARELARAKRWRDCQDVTAEGLRIEPGNEELVALQRQASQSLELEARVETLCSEVAAFLNRGDYGAALKASEQALALDPECREAMAAADQARSELEQQRKIEILVGQARAACERQDFEAARMAATKGIALAGEHKELGRLLAAAEQGLATRRVIAKLLDEARAHFEKQRLTEVIRAAREILSLSPQHAEALALEKKANEAIREKERRARAESRRAEARKAQQTGDAAGCLKAAVEGQTYDAEDKELRDLRSWAERALQEQRAERERQERVAKLLVTARRDLAERRLRRARRRFDDLLRFEPAHSEALAAKAEIDNALAGQSRTWTRHLSLASAGLLLALGGLIWFWRGSDVAGVRSDAPPAPVTIQKAPGPVQPKTAPSPPSAVAQPAEKQSPPEEDTLAQKLAGARNSLAAKDFATADRLATEALAVSGQDAAALEIQKRARKQLAEITGYKRQVKELVSSGKYSEAQTALASLQRLSPSDADFQELSTLLQTRSRQAADSGRSEVEQLRPRAEKSAADAGVSLAPAQRLDTEAARLYQSGDYAASAVKFSQARDAYLELDKRAAEIIQGRQLEGQKQSVLSAKRSFDESRTAAEQANADSLASTLFSRAKTAAASAELKLQQNDFDGAEQAYQSAKGLMDQAAESARKAGEAARAAKRTDDDSAGQKQLVQESQRRLAAARGDFSGEDSIAAAEETKAQQLLKEGRLAEAASAFDDAARRYQASRSASGTLNNVITTYGAAFSAKDLKTLRSLWPDMDQSNLESFRSTFQINEAISLSFAPVRFSFDDDQAVVVCRAELSMTPKGERRQVSRSSDSATFRMARSGNSWVIRSFVGNFRSK